jgi:hypothetical protein
LSATTKPSPEVLRLQRGPIFSTLIRLSLPNVLAMVMTVLVGIAETYYIGRLGTTQLAAMALVFPFAMLTGMMSAGAMGGGVSSAVSRALGASDTLRANTLAFHALVIGAGTRILYTLVFLVFGPAFYRVLGGTDNVLDEATRYSTVLFSGALAHQGTNVTRAVKDSFDADMSVKLAIEDQVVCVRHHAQVDGQFATRGAHAWKPHRAPHIAPPIHRQMKALVPDCREQCTGQSR